MARGTYRGTNRKRTSIGRAGNRMNMSSMNKHKRRSFKKYVAQGKK
jgi:hypothetical protein